MTDASEYREEQLSLLEKSLRDLGTPTAIVHSIMQGLTHWLTPITTRSRAPTCGSVLSFDILVTAAYQEQFYDLDWFQLCLGRVSKLWKKGLVSFNCKRQPIYGSSLLELIPHHLPLGIYKKPMALKKPVHSWLLCRGISHHHNTRSSSATGHSSLQTV